VRRAVVAGGGHDRAGFAGEKHGRVRQRASRNTGDDRWYVVWGPFLMAGAAFLLGVPVFLAVRKHMTTPPAVPPYR
jgi:hypothetical protein